MEYLSQLIIKNVLNDTISYDKQFFLLIIMVHLQYMKEHF